MARILFLLQFFPFPISLNWLLFNEDEFNDHFSPESCFFKSSYHEGLYPVMKLLTPGPEETTWRGALSLSSSMLNGTGSTRK